MSNLWYSVIVLKLFYIAFYVLGCYQINFAKREFKRKLELNSKAGLDISVENLYYSRPRSWNETTFPNFQINMFCYSSYKRVQNHMTSRLHTYIYVCYILLVSFQTLHTKNIWENETYFHYLSHTGLISCKSFKLH